RSSADRVLGVIAGAAPPARPDEPWQDQQRYVTNSFLPFSALPAFAGAGVCAAAVASAMRPSATARRSCVVLFICVLLSRLSSNIDQRRLPTLHHFDRAFQCRTEV